ncbi:hypothetical protein FA95DRAFT_1559990 [Auriscalpium vulgare]|uniref:Uncharacterized protein n=1 Tax=Auriscalpium vulgare TaxID=40419 RepID=A0ACB8RR08_9AGAM|nr:hypothetical protein FA95DRAFT_1559990 [Auriscalpium vulgare]
MTDVEMVDDKFVPEGSPHSALPVSHRASPMVEDDDHRSGGSSEDVNQQLMAKPSLSRHASDKTPALAAPSPASSSGHVPQFPPPAPKPKSVKAARPRSPSPSPPPPPAPPLKTVRLEIRLGGPENYEVDVASLAKATGQRPSTPVAATKRYESESDGDGDGEGDGAEAEGGDGAAETGKGKRGKRKNLAAEYYDLNDPFIDDSELAVDERKFFAQTKQQGFYVSSGEVALLKDKTPKKPKSKRSHLPPPEPIAGPSNFPHVVKKADKDKEKEKEKEKEEEKDRGRRSDTGTKEAPITLLDDDDRSSSTAKRKNAESEAAKKKRKVVVDIHPFHPELEAAIEDLKAEIAKESWEVKGKFPLSIKPLLADIALKAIKLNEYDENFFNLMPRIFPYNRFTMMKLIKRTVFQDHMMLLTQRQDELLLQLQRTVNEGFEKAQEEYERSVQQWEKRQEKAKADGTGSASTEGTPSMPQIPLASADDAAAMDVDKSADGDGKDGKDGKDSHPPFKKYKMTEAMKGTVWNLVCLSNECCRIENEKNTLENSTTLVSEQGLRKILYQKIVASFPDGWMSSGQISREVSVMKKKFEKEAMDSES